MQCLDSLFLGLRLGLCDLFDKYRSEADNCEKLGLVEATKYVRGRGILSLIPRDSTTDVQAVQQMVYAVRP